MKIFLAENYNLLVATIIILFCCFSPILVILFAIFGLGFLTGYLDFVLFPILFILIILLTISAFRQIRKQSKTYQCQECKLFYNDEKIKNGCQTWCKEHKSCNLEIIKHAIKK